MTALVHRDDRAGAAVLRLDSPHNRNALSKQLVGELGDHLAEAATDETVRVVAVTASGGTFCSGADLTDPPVNSGPGSFSAVLAALWDYPKPVLVAVNGHVRAGGFGLVGVADVVLCADTATFALTEVRLGLVPAIISVPLARRMAPLALQRYMLTGEKFGPSEAVAAGLVTTVVPAADLDGALAGMVAEFGSCEPEALRVTRELLRRVPTMSVADGFDHTQVVSERTFGSAVAAEGIAAFREKRAPAWAVQV